MAGSLRGRRCRRLLSVASMVASVAVAVLVHALPILGQSPLGIPGTSQTISGYDTEMGTDAICWRSHGVSGNHTEATTNSEAAAVLREFPNPLKAKFLLSERIELLESCPFGNVLHASAPVEALRGERLRTGRLYDYAVRVELNLTSLKGDRFVSDPLEEGGIFSAAASNHRVAIQIVVCSLGDSGFCSPFIHEQSNARLARLGLPLDPPPGYRHGESHVHSPYAFISLLPEDGPVYRFNMSVPMLVNEAGSYFAIAAVQMFVDKSDDSSSARNATAALQHVRYDIANALDTAEFRIVTYQDPPEILHVPDGVLVASYLAISIVACTIAFLLVETVKHRNHQVLKLTQSNFLIVFLAAAFTATVGSVLFEPKNDTYCRFRHAVVLIPFQLMYAITTGRLWRIHAVISPLLVSTLRSKQDENGLLGCGCARRFVQWIPLALSRMICAHDNKAPEKESASSQPVRALRRKITDWQLARVVALFTLPQVLLQTLALILQPAELIVEFNEDESVGRVACSAGVPLSHSLAQYGLYLFLLLVIVLMVMAAATRNLPSLLNETRVIFDSALSTLILEVLGLGIVVVTDGSTTSPAVQYLVLVALTLSLCLNCSIRLMRPKLRMVWRRETILVSKLVSDHNSRVKGRSEADSILQSHNITGLNLNNGVNSNEHNHRKDNDMAPSYSSSSGTVETISHNFPKDSSNSCEVLDEMEGFGQSSDHREEPFHEGRGETDDCERGQQLQQRSLSDGAKAANEEDENSGSVSTTVTGNPASSSVNSINKNSHVGAIRNRTPKSNALRRAFTERFCHHPTTGQSQSTIASCPPLSSQGALRRNSRHSGRRIVVSREEAPARTLVLKMVDLQEQLSVVTDRIMAGLVVSEEDWEMTRRMIGRSAEVFHNEVKFRWEAEETPALQQQHQQVTTPLILEHSGQQNGEAEEEEEEADRLSFIASKRSSNRTLNGAKEDVGNNNMVDVSEMLVD